MLSTVRFGAAQPHHQTAAFSSTRKTNNTATPQVSVDTVRFGNNGPSELLDLPAHLANVLDGLLMKEREKPEFCFEEKRAAAIQPWNKPCSERVTDAVYMREHKYNAEARLVAKILVEGINKLVASGQVNSLPTLSVKEHLALRREARPGLRFNEDSSKMTIYANTPQLLELIETYAPPGQQQFLLEAAILIQDPKRNEVSE